MAKIKKKGTTGQAKNFLTRSQAVRKLQISLPDFRRLCIFKGIYPREPRNRKKASKSSTPATTFYYTKDIQYLLHEPLIQKFRDHKALGKKIRKALGKGEVKDAARLERNLTPKITLDHIIKERYPTFVDALRDLDDALSMLFLFANLPTTTSVPSKTIALCQRLCHEFQHYLIVSHSLRKSFLSIKGIYYQATIQGQDILWLVPYKFVQNTSGDIDFRIMGTFVEFYTTLLGFVNYRLYTTVGLVYPPKFDVSSDDRGGELSAFQIQARADRLPFQTGEVSAEVQQLSEDEEPSRSSAVDERAQAEADRLALEASVNEEDDVEEADAEDAAESGQIVDKFETAVSGGDELLRPEVSGEEAATLFEDLTFFLSRETPRQPLEFLLRAFGCKNIGWDAVLGDGACSTDEVDTRFTHQVVDRPPPRVLPGEEGGSNTGKVSAGTRISGRTYIQPQWVWDCVNARKLLPPHEYAPGATLPPHLSPWVKPKKGTYDPTVPLAEQELEGEAEAAELEAELQQQIEAEEKAALAQVPQLDDNEIAGDMGAAAADSEDGLDGENREWGGMSSDESDEEDEDDEASEERRYQQELEAEARGVPLEGGHSKSSKDKRDEVRRQAQKKRREEAGELERKMMMMSQKKRKLMGQMMHGNKQRDAEAEKLRAKRRRIEREKGQLS